MPGTRTPLAVLALLALAAGPALADDDRDDDRCRAGNTGWMSIAAISEKALAEGFTVTEIERDDGCYEIKGTARDGTRVKVKMHPSTGEVVQVRDRDDDDDRDDG